MIPIQSSMCVVGHKRAFRDQEYETLEGRAPMRSRSLFNHRCIRSIVLRSACLSLLIVASACWRMPNTIPPGYDDVFQKTPARASTAAMVDYPIVYMMKPDATSVPFLVSKTGERVWFWQKEFREQQLWKSVTWYRVALIAQGVPEAICYTEWVEPDSSKDTTKIDCKLTKNATVKDYFSKPLIGMLDYWVGDVDGENKKPEDTASPTAVVDRVFVLIPNSEGYSPR